MARHSVCRCWQRRAPSHGATPQRFRTYADSAALIEIVQGMKEVTLDELADAMLEDYAVTPTSRRLLVAIAGAPGSGKSTLAYPLTDLLNTRLGNPPDQTIRVDPSTALASPSSSHNNGGIALCVGLDGFHCSRAELDRWDDPEDAHWRRGAYDTFDLARYLTFLQSLRLPLSPTPPLEIPFPTFDHALKDPAPSPFPIRPSHRIILVEGLYTLLDKDGWRDCAEMYDLRVYVDSDPVIVRERVIRRNFQAGIVDDIDKCAARVDAVDMKNGEVVRRNLYKVDYVMRPVDNPLLKS